MYDGSEKTTDPLFGGSFVFGISLNQIVRLQERNEDRMLEKAGFEENEFYKTFDVSKSNENKVFVSDSDIESYNESVSAERAVVYDLSKESNEPDLNFMQSKFGRLR